MARPPFDPKELEPTGEFYPPGRSFFEVPAPPDPILNYPISPKDNMKLLFSGKKPYWFPNTSFMGGDTVGFRPRINGDNIANHQVFDGGPPFDYSGYGKIITSSWFDMEWEQTELSLGGGMPRPGKPRVPDITEWEKYVEFPDLDSMDWDECREQNIGYLGTNKFNTLGIQCGLWERLMNLLDVSEACIALVDEDLKPHTHRFLDQLCDFLIDYIRRIYDNCAIDGVVIHEDWATARSPFMAPEVASEMLVPYVKRITDWLHERGLFYEIHMCGETSLLIPCYIEAGVDYWSAIQPTLYDAYGLAKQYKDSPLAFGLSAPMVDDKTPDDEMREAAKALVDEFKDCKVTFSFVSMSFDGTDVPQYHPGYAAAVYEYSRIAYGDEPEL